MKPKKSKKAKKQVAAVEATMDNIPAVIDVKFPNELHWAAGNVMTYLSELMKELGDQKISRGTAAGIIIRCNALAAEVSLLTGLPMENKDGFLEDIAS
jgi:hypothetical protein